MALRFDATRILRNVEANATAIITQSANDVLNIADQFVPVDKGDLKRSGRVEVVSPTKVRIGYGDVNVDYAKYQEYGTSNMAAQPFLTPAMAQAESIVRARSASARAVARRRGR
jgi:HK97 gp10 family phage protein